MIECFDTEAFIEDPLRVFRVARFAAQPATVAAETQALMRNMTAAGEPETCRLRLAGIYQSFGAAQPQRWFQVLAECGGLTRSGRIASATTRSSTAAPPEQRFATLNSLQSLGKRLRIPKHYLQLATDRLVWRCPTFLSMVCRASEGARCANRSATIA